MKKIKFFSWVLSAFLIISVFESCNKDDTMSTNLELNSLKLNTNLYNTWKQDLATSTTTSEILFLKDKKQFKSQNDLINARKNSENLQTLTISSSVIDLENLNDVFNIESTSVTAITLFKDSDSEIARGIVIHHYESNGEDMKLYIYNIVNENTFEKINIDAKVVNEFTYDQLFYISKEYFPGKDIETLIINNINDYTSENKFDDFSILEIVSRLGTESKYDNFSFTDVYIDGEISDGKACGIVPLCWNGATNTYCAPFAQGCRVKGGCGVLTVADRFSQEGMDDENTEFNSILPSELLYSFRDELELYFIGNFLIESYYTTTKHFEETIDVELLLEILLASPKLYDVILAFVQDDPNYVLTEETFGEIATVVNLSVSKSQNNIYIDFMSKLVDNLQTFVGKNIGEIKTLLIPIE